MARSGNQAALEGARAEILAVAAQFRAAAGPIVDAALRRRIQALGRSRREWHERMSPEAGSVFEDAADRAIRAGTREVERRLALEDVWFQPFTAPGVVRRPETGWDGMAPEWITGFLRRFTRQQDTPTLGELDDPGNRVWVALLSAATPLDPVLEELGLAPSSIPKLGGGHYGLQPRTAAQLDPTGVLLRLWKRYRLVHDRYAALARAED